jgi:hypothetical protein
VDNFEMRLRRRPEPLALPFSLIGGIAGWFSPGVLWALDHELDNCFGDVLPYWADSDGDPSLFLCAFGALAFSAVGWLLSRELASGARIRLAAALSAVFVGLAPGALSELSGESFGQGFMLGWLAAPACCLCAHYATRAWEARSGTLAASVFRRSTWLVVVGFGVVITLASARRMLDHLLKGTASLLLSVGADPSEHAAGALVTLVCSAGAAGLLVTTARDRLRLAALDQRVAGRTGPERGSYEQVDLGVGNQTRDRTSAARDAYRDCDRVVLSVRGDFGSMRQVLGIACVVAIGIGAIVAIGMFATFPKPSMVFCE